MFDGWTRSNFWLNISISSRIAPNAHRPVCLHTDSTMEIIYWVVKKKKLSFFIPFWRNWRVPCDVCRAYAHEEQCHWSHCFWCCVPFSSSSSSSSSFFMCVCVSELVWDDFFFRLLVRCERDHLYTSLSPNIRVSHKCETIACIWIGVSNRAFEIFVEFSNMFWWRCCCCCCWWYFYTHAFCPFDCTSIYFYFFSALPLRSPFSALWQLCMAWFSAWLAWPISVFIFCFLSSKEQHRKKAHTICVFSIKSAYGRFCFCLDSNRETHIHTHMIAYRWFAKEHFVNVAKRCYYYHQRLRKCRPSIRQTDSQAGRSTARASTFIIVSIFFGCMNRPWRFLSF